MRTHNSHTHLPVPQAGCQAAQTSHRSQSLSKSVPALTLEKNENNEKHESTTLAIRNAGERTDIKVITFNKLFGRRTVNCLENPHYAYTEPLGNSFSVNL